MTVSIHGYPKFKFFLPSTNQLAVGAKLFTYEPGTTTKKTSYQDFDKNTSNTNPIILDANGECTLFLDGKYKLVLAPANDTDPPASAYWTLDEVGDTDVTADLVGVSNKIPNGSAETDTDGDGVPDDWTFTAGTGNTIAVDTTSNWHGTTSVKHTIASANTSVQQSSFFEVQEGQLEILRWAMIASAADIDVTVRLKWYTAAQVFISNSDVYADSATNPLTWTDKSVLFTPPSTARYAKLEVRCATTGKNANFDNFRTQVFEFHDVAVTVTGLWTFSDQSSVIGGVTASNLVDKSATETVSGLWTFSNPITKFGNSPPGAGWASSFSALEVGQTSAISAGGTSTNITENAYYDNTDSRWEFLTTGEASLLQLASGTVGLYTTASGTADTAITWTTALIAGSNGIVKGLGGNWLISPSGGDTTPGNDLVIYNSAAASDAYTQYINDGTGSTSADGFIVGIDTAEQAVLVNRENTDMFFYTNNLQEMYLDASNRGLVVGTPAGAGQGVGTVNASGGFYDNDVAVPNVGSSPTVTGLWTFSDAIILGTASDQGTGTISASGGVYENDQYITGKYLGAETLGSNSTTWTPSITLDLDTDGKYIIDFYIVENVGASAGIGLQFNSDTSSVYQHANILSSGGTLSASNSSGTSINLGQISDSTGNDNLTGTLEITYINGGEVITVRGKTMRVDPLTRAIGDVREIFGTYDAGGTNITSYSFNCSTGSGIGIGSTTNVVARGI